MVPKSHEKNFKPLTTAVTMRHIGCHRVKELSGKKPSLPSTEKNVSRQPVQVTYSNKNIIHNVIHGIAPLEGYFP